MAFSDQLTADFDGILGLGEAESAITYRRKDGTELAVNAIVMLTDPVGVVDEAGPRPLTVLLSKTDLPTVHVGREFFEYSGRVYRIKDIESETSAWWELYCVATG